MMKNLFLAVLFTLLGAAGALAHSFNVTMLVPDGAREGALAAFLIASAERDSHADEESDGHLGGLDVYVTMLESGRAGGMADSAPDIVVDLRGGAAPMKGVWFLPLPEISARAKAEFLSGFDARFQAATGAAPGDLVRRVYVAARLIDLAVRAQEGASDKAALAAAVAGY